MIKVSLPIETVRGLSQQYVKNITETIRSKPNKSISTYWLKNQFDVLRSMNTNHVKARDRDDFVRLNLTVASILLDRRETVKNESDQVGMETNSNLEQ